MLAGPFLSRLFAALLGAAATVPCELLAQTEGGAAAKPVAGAPALARSLAAYETREPVKVDGLLDEAAWRAASPASGFVQSEPRTGEPATEDTEVRVLFDATTLYVGAYLHDREPGGFVVSSIKKDVVEGEQDDFEVIFDTFHDHRNGYVFITNVEGSRTDRQVANEGKETNASWDAVWTVKTRRVADGWTVEMAIPFRSLRFDFASAPSWGINFSRRIRRKNEIDFWAPVPRAFNLDRASLAGELTGIGHEGTARDLRVKPYMTARTIRETRTSNFVNGADLGLDLKYGVTQGLTLDVTVNPDFAQVEADEQQVNLTQFSQFFPEKREFFLENSGIFYVGDATRKKTMNQAPTPDEDMLLFYSRRIGLTSGGNPLALPGGVRLTGKAGGFRVGALSMESKRLGKTPANNYSVLRLRRDFWANSDMGIIVQSRQSTDSTGSWNRVFGGDLNIRFPGNIDWSSYAVGTRTPGVSSGQYAFRTSASHEDNFVHYKLGVLQIGEGFADDMGYFRRTDVRKYILEFGVKPRPPALQKVGLLEMHPHMTLNYYEDLRGQVVGKKLHFGYTFVQKSGGQFEFFATPRFERLGTSYRIDPAIAPIPAGSYSWTEYQIKGMTDPSRVISAGYDFIGGGLWSGTQRTQLVTATLRGSYRFTATVGVSHTEATLNSPKAKFEALLWTVRSTYSLTTNMFVDAFAQYDPRRHLLNANLRFNVIHHPLSDLFIVFNEQRFITPDAPTAGRGVIVKFTQMLSL